MTTSRRASLWVSCLLALSASAGFAQSDLAQQPLGPPPAHLSIIEGQAYVDREGRSDPAIANLPLLDGDRLRTTDGRLEVILPDGSLLHVDRDTTVDVMATDLLRLLGGRVYIVARGARDPQRAVRYQVDAPVASVQTGGPGEFRVWSAETARGREVELAVFRGVATIASNHGAEELRAGERSIVRDGMAPSAPQYFNSARWDDFDRWSAAQREQHLGTVSAQYLPSELAAYASTLDQYGTWRYEPEEGAVWYPAVASDWRPYSVGYWRTYPAWGSFWIGGDAWGWPTHHYGYWGFSLSLGWYWRPATIWGPAWVSWAYSPGYVSWCPLGRFGYPVFGHFGIRGHHGGNHVDPWRGWTVMPRQHYGMSTPVHRVAVDGRRLDPGVRGAFTPGRPGPGAGPERGGPRPGASGIAVPRYAAGGSVAVPRGSATRAAPRPGSSSAPAGPTSTEAVPRAGGTRGLPDGRARLSPDEAARVFAGSGSRTSATAARRTLPAAPAFGDLGRRTEAPAATPDVTAFGDRRAPASAVPRASGRAGRAAQFGDGSPARFGNGTPAQFGDGSPARFGSGTPAQFGDGSTTPSGSRAPGIFGSSARSRTYPRANPSSETAGANGEASTRSRGETRPPYVGDASGSRAWSPPPAVRQNPYFSGGGDAGTVERRASPRADPRSVPPDTPYIRGGGMPTMRGSGGGESAPSARPRDGSGGAPAGAGLRGGTGSSSARPAAPRYNPGSGASQPRGGGSSSSPARRRGGNPD
jgi:hypothetical protein